MHKARLLLRDRSCILAAGRQRYRMSERPLLLLLPDKKIAIHICIFQKQEKNMQWAATLPTVYWGLSETKAHLITTVPF